MTVLLHAGDLAARRQAAPGTLHPLADSLARDLEPLMGRDVFIPPEKARMTRRGGRCEQDGTMLEFTLVVAADAMPAPVMKIINDAAKGATLGRLEKISVSYETKDGKVVKLPEALTRYAAEMAKGKKTAEVIVNADGTVFEAPEWVEPKPEAKAAK